MPSVRTRGPGALLLCGLALAASACGGSSHDAKSAANKTSRATSSTTATTAAPATTTTVAPTTVPAPTVPAPTAPETSAPETRQPAATTPPPPATTPPTPPAPLLVNRLSGIGSAQQVIAVSAAGYGTSSATVTAYERDASGWKQVFGPWFAYIGRNGVAPSGAKREGDGRTPSGVYGFDFMFGVNADPGVHYPFRRVTGSNIVWDDDPSSTSYNEWIDTDAQPAGADPEPMYNTPSYFYGAVIAYNDARTPGLGSAIFLHVSHGSSTAGCVALPTDQLLALLRWLDPARSPRIAIGTAATLTNS
jgi:L,D-peptidoglycan transpeptidase YkuD (ErfK/YbiS/YcfS/YnhG family)